MQIDLNSKERRLILMALKEKHFKALIQEPKTKAFIRRIYRELIDKIAKDEALHQDMQETMGSASAVIAKVNEIKNG